MTDPIPIVQRHQRELTAQAIDSAAAIALLSLAREKWLAEQKAAQIAYKDKMHRLGEWSQADQIALEIAEATKEQRQERAELMAAVRKIMAATTEGKKKEHARLMAGQLKHRIEAEMSSGGQWLMPFMDRVE
jgi:16S rRNA C1402 N4-methylase RsmH